MASDDFILKILKEKIAPLEKRLKIPPEFFMKLLKEDSDWSFIIKLNALVEVALAHHLATKLRKNELQNTFLRLDLASKETGQLAFLKALGLLENQRNFIFILATIRNDYVHDISNVSLRFEDYFYENERGKKRLKDLYSAIKKVFIGIDKKNMETLTKKTPRWIIWFLGMVLMAEIYTDISSSSLLVQALAKSYKK